ncbi:MAG: phasin family protein [Desulfovibrionales bacterium]
MIELIRKSLLLGLGAALVTRDAVREKIQYLVEQGKLTTEEAEQLTNELVDTGEKELGRVREEIARVVRDSLDSMDLARRSRLDELQQDVDNLANRMDLLEDRSKRGES